LHAREGLDYPMRIGRARWCRSGFSRHAGPPLSTDSLDSFAT
jgi:hypothetical protein